MWMCFSGIGVRTRHVADKGHPCSLLPEVVFIASGCRPSDPTDGTDSEANSNAQSRSPDRVASRIPDE
jgi:hypothetical protein